MSKKSIQSAMEKPCPRAVYTYHYLTATNVAMYINRIDLAWLHYLCCHCCRLTDKLWLRFSTYLMTATSREKIQQYARRRQNRNPNRFVCLQYRKQQTKHCRFTGQIGCVYCVVTRVHSVVCFPALCTVNIKFSIRTRYNLCDFLWRKDRRIVQW